jgi:hypothetical protein
MTPSGEKALRNFLFFCDLISPPEMASSKKSTRIEFLGFAFRLLGGAE